MSEAAASNVVAIAKTWPADQLALFQKILQNVADNPGEVKFRKLKLSNARIAALYATPGSPESFEVLGWVSADLGGALELPTSSDLSMLVSVLKRTSEPVPPGDMLAITVLRGALKTKLDMPAWALPSALAAAIEQNSSLGCVPRNRQRLLTGYPPKLIEECHPGYADMSLAELGLKAVKLEDTWEEVVADLRTGRATFSQLAAVVKCRKTVQDNRDFLLDSARSLLKVRAAGMSPEEVKAARDCFSSLWPSGDPSTKAQRVAFCIECTPLAVPSGPAGDAAPPPASFALEVERADLFASAVTQVGRAAAADLRCSLEVRFAGEAAEDAGGPRREFFNEFGLAARTSEGIWCMTPAGAIVPVSASPLSSRPTDHEVVFQSCGRIFGLALCQVENAAQEQRVEATATLADLLATVREPEEQPKQHQKLLLGLPLSRTFVRLLQCDEPEGVEDLQSELNAEQSESAPDFRGSEAFLKSSLDELGLVGQLTFSCVTSDGKAVDLVSEGHKIEVTDDTKLKWLQATLRHQLVDSISDAAAAFRTGVLEAAGAAHLVLLSATELREEWSGTGDVRDADLKFWQEHTRINPTRKQQAAWFFELLWGELRELRPRVLKFSTGSDRWAPDSQGFTFCIEPMDGGDDSLPRAMTCGNMLQLPTYSSRETLRDQLLKACEWGVSMSLV